MGWHGWAQHLMRRGTQTLTQRESAHAPSEEQGRYQACVAMSAQDAGHKRKSLPPSLGVT
jgi:hypothetical protein